MRRPDGVFRWVGTDGRPWGGRYAAVCKVDTIFEVFSEHTPKPIDKLLRRVYNYIKRRVGRRVVVAPPGAVGRVECGGAVI